VICDSSICSFGKTFLGMLDICVFCYVRLELLVPNYFTRAVLNSVVLASDCKVQPSQSE
jgi:hypothetical protein